MPQASIAGLFFFQAEDGIRDPLVTGVQTCALPIWLNRFQERWPEIDVRISATDNVIDLSAGDFDIAIRYGGGRYPEIGRASCRERVDTIVVVRASIRKKSQYTA